MAMESYWLEDDNNFFTLQVELQSEIILIYETLFL